VIMPPRQSTSVPNVSIAERAAGIRKFGLHLTKKGLAFHSKESVNVVRRPT